MSSAPALVVSYWLLNYFPGSRDAELAGALLQLWAAKMESEGHWGLCGLQAGSLLHHSWTSRIRPTQTFRSILGPCSWWYLALLVDLHAPQRQADRQRHPPSCSPATTRWPCWGCHARGTCSSVPCQAGQGGSRAALPITNPVKHSTALSGSSEP